MYETAHATLVRFLRAAGVGVADRYGDLIERHARPAEPDALMLADADLIVRGAPFPCHVYRISPFRLVVVRTLRREGLCGCEQCRSPVSGCAV